MRNRIAVLLLGTALLATSAFAVGIKGPARPNKTLDQAVERQAAESLALQLEASLPKATSLQAPL
jgi:hypothetical protein